MLDNAPVHVVKDPRTNIITTAVILWFGGGPPERQLRFCNVLRVVVLEYH